MSIPTLDLPKQRRISQAVSRFFIAMQSRFRISDREAVMLMLASTWGQARKVGLTTPQLIEWALKNWGECDAAMAKASGDLVVTGQGADVTKSH